MGSLKALSDAILVLMDPIERVTVGESEASVPSTVAGSLVS